MRKKLTIEEFIDKANCVHNNKYDYSESNYINIKTKIRIICPKHGLFFQRPEDHLNGQGCPECGRMISGKKTSFTQKLFVERSKKVHGNKYDYSKSVYVGARNKLCVICPKHGEFWQTADAHIRGQGCPECSKHRVSKGEDLIKKFLEERKVDFIHNKACLDFLGELRPDFYLPDYNLIIEYDGEQHFKPVDLFGGDEEFLKTQERDKLKNKLCEEHNIKLVRISYTQFNEIEEIIDSIIC